MIYSGAYGRYEVPTVLEERLTRDANLEVIELPWNMEFWIWVNQQEIKASHELLFKTLGEVSGR